MLLSVRQGGFDAHTTLWNKDLPARIRYSSIPESYDRITWIPSQVKKAIFFFCFVCMLNRQYEPNSGIRATCDPDQYGFFIFYAYDLYEFV